MTTPVFEHSMNDKGSFGILYESCAGDSKFNHFSQSQTSPPVGIMSRRFMS